MCCGKKKTTVLRLCLTSGCGEFADPASKNGSRCPDCESDRNRARNQQPGRQLYNDPSYKNWKMGTMCEWPDCRSTEDLTKDHIIPIVRGGTNHPSNLRTLCRSHNDSKGAN